MQVSGLVSTIIPVHNRPDMLREAVTSVLAQTYRPIEIIIVDDGSADETADACEQLAAAHPEIRVLHQANAGPGAARERGRLAAHGEFIQYLDSDDRLLPEKFARQVAALHADPDCDVAYCKIRYYDFATDAPPETALKRTGERIPTMFPGFLQSRWWSTIAPLRRRSLSDKTGPWLSLLNEEDWEYDCRTATFGGRLAYCEEFLAEMRHHEGARASHGGTADKRKLADRAKAHGLILRHALRYGVSREAPEMRCFARELFLLARQCGAAGLGKESEALFGLAREASTPERARGWDFRLYGGAAHVTGWPAMGKLSCIWLDRLRDGFTSRRSSPNANRK
jgi:glycosyltransferase involved in cell wall biosynthesis